MNVMSANKRAVDHYLSIKTRIKEFCKPLNDYFGISYFAYFKIYLEDSSYIMFSTDAEYTKEYYTKIHSEVMYFQQYLENANDTKVILWPRDPFNLGSNLIFNRGYWHGLNIITRMDNKIAEGFDFVTTKDNYRINEFYTKHYNVLKKFIEQFKMTFADSITKAESCKAKYQNGFIPYLPEYQEISALDIKDFLKSIGMTYNNLNIDGKHIKITSSELECLELLAHGYGIKEIAKRSARGHRTVETLLNRIKIKTEITGYGSKSQLINLYNQNLKF